MRLVLLGLLLLVGCQHGGRLMVVVESEGPVFEVEVEVEGRTTATRTFLADAGPTGTGRVPVTPFSFVVVPTDPAQAVDVTVRGYGCDRSTGTCPAIERRERARVTPNTTRVLRILLADRCAGVTCVAGMDACTEPPCTCGPNGCENVPTWIEVPLIPPGGEFEAGRPDAGTIGVMDAPRPDTPELDAPIDAPEEPDAGDAPEEPDAGDAPSGPPILTGMMAETFGYSVAVNDSVLLVGAPYADTSAGVGSGRVAVFSWPAGSRTIVPEGELLPPTGMAQFGAALGLSDAPCFAVVGAPLDAGNAGYAEVRPCADWSVAGWFTGGLGQRVGRAVAIASDASIAWIGAVAFVFELRPPGWTSTVSIRGAGDNGFGSALAVAPVHGLIGVPDRTVASEPVGGVLSSVVGSGTPSVPLTAVSGGHAGASIAIDGTGDRAVVATDDGLAVLVRSAGVWTLETTLLLPGGEPNRPVVAIDGDGTRIVAAVPSLSPTGTGVAAYYDRGTSWTDPRPLGSGTGGYGVSVAISPDGQHAVVGAHRAAAGDGAVHPYVLP